MPDSFLYVPDSDIFPADLRKAFEAFNEGVVPTDALEVTAGAVGLSIDVADGTAYVQGDAEDDQGLYRVHIGTPQNSDTFDALDSAHATLPRVDRVILRVYDDAVDGSGDTAWYLQVLAGTPTAGATLVNENGAVAIPDTALHLANVLVPATATSITSPDIEDKRVSAFADLVSGAVGDHGETHETDGSDPIPSLPTADQKDAMDAAATPATAANPFVTEADNGSLPAPGAEETVLAIDSGVAAYVDPKQVLPTRVFLDFNTSSLADDAEDATITLGMEPSVRAIMFESDFACRFRLYMTNADRTADAARPVGTDPTGDHGLLMEVVTDVDLIIRLTPQVDMSADPFGDQTRQYATSYYAAVQNVSGATHVVNCTLTYLPTERR